MAAQYSSTHEWTQSASLLTDEQRMHQATESLIAVSGGLDGLVHRFAEADLSALMRCWLAGRRRRVTPHQMYHLVGHELLVQLAQSAGLSLAQTLAGIAAHLPMHVMLTARNVEANAARQAKAAVLH